MTFIARVDEVPRLNVREALPSVDTTKAGSIEVGTAIVILPANFATVEIEITVATEAVDISIAVPAIAAGGTIRSTAIDR